jgi:hypothetical protein
MEVLARAEELVDEILEMTKALTLTGDKEQREAEVTAYALLMEEREPLVDELTELRQQITDEEAASAEFTAITETIARITALDKKHVKFMGELRDDTQTSYKEVKLGQRIHAGYNPLPGNEVSSVFDIKS